MKLRHRFKVGDKVQIVRPMYHGSNQLMPEYYRRQYAKKGKISGHGYNGYRWRIKCPRITFNADSRELKLVN